MIFSRIVLFVLLGLVASVVGGSLFGLPAEAAMQAQPSPSPKPGATPTRTAEQAIQELERRKLEMEVRLVDMQEERERQERDSGKQIWRAPAEALSMVGPTFVGLGLLYLLWRALKHFLPAAPPRPARVDSDFEDEDDL